jgi:hypothetical protein
MGAVRGGAELEVDVPHEVVRRLVEAAELVGPDPEQMNARLIAGARGGREQEREPTALDDADEEVPSEVVRSLRGTLLGRRLR